MKLPDEFVRKVKNVWGVEGAQWAEGFPGLLADCVETWGLHDLTPYSEIYYNMIIGARTENGHAVVLKLGVPNEELSSEVEALKAYGGRGAVRLLDADPEKGALLLERLTPGTDLHDLHDNRRETEIAAGLITRLTIPPPEGHQFVKVSDWFEVFDRIETGYDPEAYGLPREMIRTAREFSAELLDTMEGEWLLHGDLHHFNILFDEVRGWTAIDPKGAIGDKAFQPARFLGNPYPHLLSSSDPEADTLERVVIFSEVLELDPRRVLRWGYVDRIVSSGWSIEEDGEEPTFSITCARIMAKILKNFA